MCLEKFRRTHGLKSRVSCYNILFGVCDEDRNITVDADTGHHEKEDRCRILVSVTYLTPSICKISGFTCTTCYSTSLLQDEHI